jgi:murein DD-endopeptidase
MGMIHRSCIAVVCIALSVAGTTADAQAREPLHHSAEMRVPVAPRFTTIAGVRTLVHELHLSSFTSAELVVRRIDLLGARGDTIASFDAAALEGMMVRPGVALADAGDERRTVRPGTRAVVYFWVPLRAGLAPSAVRHVVTYDEVRVTARAERSVIGDAVAVAAERTVVLDAPLNGGPWIAIYDPMMLGGHRTAFYAFGGRARIPGRFAVDFVKVDESGARVRAGGTRISDTFGYGEELLAVAEGVVVDVRDDTPEDSLLAVASARRFAPAAASGNHIVLDVGDGRFVFYEHLKHGSVRVRKGDRVRRGQVIGQLGNSGSSSSGPHLHFHVADGSGTLEAEGVPFVFRAFDVLGGYASIDVAHEGVRWAPVAPAASGPRRNEAPAANVVVRWPDRR